METPHSPRRGGRLSARLRLATAVLGGLAAAALSSSAQASSGRRELLDDKLQEAPVSVHLSTPLGSSQSVLPGRISELRIEAKNQERETFRGKLRVVVDPWNAVSHVFLEVPVVIEPGSTAALQVPLLQRENGHSLQALLLDAAGNTVADEHINCSGEQGNLTLADIHDVSPFASAFSLGQGREFRTSAYLARAQKDNTKSREDGWILPLSHAGYTHVSAVFVDSSTFLQLSDAHRNALTEWVDRGGTVAFAVSKEADLRDAKLTALLGTSVMESGVTPATVRRVLAPSPVRNDGAYRAQGARVADLATPFSSEHVRHEFGGRGVEPSPYGAELQHGLGRIVLLAFDPNEPAVANEAFTRTKMYQLLADARQRTNASFTTLAHAEAASYSSRSLRKALDPNERFRLGLVFAAGLLCAYAILVGPVLFLRARKRGTPLAPYIVAPMLSGVTFLAIVATGSVSRGLSGGVRRLSVIEQASGSARGMEVTYRGFYPPSSTTMRIEAGPPGSLLDLALSDQDAIANERVDIPGLAFAPHVNATAGMAYADVRTRPWRTFIAREHRMVQSKGTIDLLRTGTDVTVFNGTTQTIHRPFVSVPHEGVYYLDRDIHPGESVRAKTGSLVFHRFDGEPAGQLHDYQLENALPAAERAHFRSTWGAVGELRPGGDFWPSTRATLIGEVDGTLDGRPAQTNDSGLAVRSTTVLLRVLGSEEPELQRPQPLRPPGEFAPPSQGYDEEDSR